MRSLGNPSYTFDREFLEKTSQRNWDKKVVRWNFMSKALKVCSHETNLDIAPLILKLHAQFILDIMSSGTAHWCFSWNAGTGASSFQSVQN